MSVMSDWTPSCPEELAPGFFSWGKGYPPQDENGIDLQKIRWNLQRTPLERLRRGEGHRLGVLRIRALARRVG